MTQKLAALAPEVRQILEKGSAQSAQHQDCAKLCANAAGGLPPTVAVTVSLRAAGLEAAPRRSAVHAHHAYTNSLPARGPPASS